MDGALPFAVLPLLPAAVSLAAILVASALSALGTLAAFRPAAARRLVCIVWRQKPGLIAIGLLALAVVIAPRFARRSAPPAVLKELESAHWPMFRGGLSRTGHADEKPGALSGGVQWVGGRGYQFYSSAAMVGDTVLAVGCRGDSARFFGWNAASGELLWTLAPPGYRATLSSPIASEGRLVCGEGLHHTPNARVVAFRAGQSRNLVPDFEFPTKSHVECTPAIDGQRLYFTAGDDGVYCLDLSSASAGRVVWHLPGKSFPDAETALAVHGGLVYVGLGRGGEALCAIDATTGEELARRQLPFPVFSPPAIAAGRLYLGMGPADYANQRLDSPGEVRCLDIETLETVWTLPTSASVLSAMAIRDDDLVVATVAGEILIVTLEGDVTYRWQAGASILAAPAVTKEAIYCVSCDGMLIGLEDSLKPTWSVRLGAPGQYISSPVVFGGRVFVGTPDGFMSVGNPPGESTANASADVRRHRD